MLNLLVAIVLSFTYSHTESGPLSIYHPGDGYNAGTLACGGKFDYTQVHIAHRRWRKLGCSRRVIVCARSTQRCALAKVMDAGPFGIIDGRGNWRRWTSSLRPPTGWRWRGKTDLSIALWKQLGRPRFLSTVDLHFSESPKLTSRMWRQVRVLWRGFQRMLLDPEGRGAVV